MARKITESLIAAAVTAGGIFGLIVDAPDVFHTIGRFWSALSEWARPIMSRDLGYWLLIVGGLASLAWINFGDRVKPVVRRAAGSHLLPSASLIAPQPVAISDPVVPAFDQLVRMYIIPATKLLTSLSLSLRLTPMREDLRRFFFDFLLRKYQPLSALENRILHHETQDEMVDAALDVLDKYYELAMCVDFLMSLQAQPTLQQEYNGWKRLDKQLKGQLVALAAKRGNERLYGALAEFNWISQ